MLGTLALIGLLPSLVLAQDLSRDQIERIFAQGEMVTVGQVSAKGGGRKGAAGMPDSIYPGTRDPFSGIDYDNVMVGPTKKLAWNEFSWKGISFYRYVTVYNAKRGQDTQLPEFPSITQDCYEESFNFAEWTSEHNYSVTLTIGAGLESKDLGISASVSMAATKGATFRTTRRLQAVKGIQATHTLYASSEDWEGVTYVQWYNKSKGTYGYLEHHPDVTSWAADGILGRKTYPWYFFLSNQNYILKAKRTDVEICEGYEGSFTDEQIKRLTNVAEPIPGRF